MEQYTRKDTTTSRPDSLTYSTKNGRIVYGGGGIMPDIFVPIDTVGGTNYLYQLRYRGIIQTFALNYVDKKRESLNATHKDAMAFKDNFSITDDLFNSIIKFAEEKEIERNLEQILTSKTLINRDLKAAISRNLYNDIGYYVIVNESDKTIQKAINSFR